MVERILCVDDDANILAAYRRKLRKYQVETAQSFNEALEHLAGQPFAVVLADLHMPGASGLTLFEHIRQKSPDTMRVLLTGNPEDSAVVAADGELLFRVLGKPCAMDLLVAVLDAGVIEHRARQSMRQLRNHTIPSLVAILVDLLAQAQPRLYGPSIRIFRLLDHLTQGGAITPSWQLSLAALLSQVGCLQIPSNILAKIERGLPLDAEEAETYAQRFTTGAAMVGEIPLLSGVAHIIGKLDENRLTVDDSETSLLSILREVDRLRAEGRSAAEVLDQLGHSTESLPAWWSPLQQALDSDSPLVGIGRDSAD